MITGKTYECKICWNVNHVSRLHCSTCGTIPAEYSWKRKPVIERHNELDAIDTLEVYVSFGCERQTSRRTIKRLLRTVPLDYYASE